MTFYRNQEIQITGKFVGIADDGKIQVKIKGIDHVQLAIDPQYVNAGGAPTGSAVPQQTHQAKAKKRKSKKKVKIKPEPAKEDEDDPWGDSDEDTKQQTAEEEAGADAGVDADTGADADAEAEATDEKDDSNDAMLDASELSLGQERFHKKHKFKTITLENGASVIKTTEDKMIMCAFGTVECGESGKIYHWKTRILEGKDVNLGVIFSEFAKKNRKDMWWVTDEGYSYWGDDGQIYHSDKYKKYGETYGAGDTIDVWLNLKKYIISFAKNDEKYGKAFKVNKEKTYRFAVGLSGHPHTLQMIEFDIN